MDDSDLRVFVRHPLGLVFIADQCGDLPVGMSIGNGVKAITANIACCTGSIARILDLTVIPSRWIGRHLQEDLWGSHYLGAV